MKLGSTSSPVVRFPEGLEDSESHGSTARQWLLLQLEPLG